MRQFLIALCLTFLAPLLARAAGPVCAIIDPDQAPRVPLLEAKLLADGSATWVERAGVEKILREQQLQAAFGPQGVGDRVKLGKLLKADVLVLVRRVKEPEGALEVVVCETASGLRLAVRAVPVTASADADTAALVAAVREGIDKHGAKIKEVVAVPPFVSQNLTTENDHLKAAYSKLVEQVALARPGVVVVELAEAETLAREIALTAPAVRIDRPLPTYLFGEYRLDGQGQARVVTVRLRSEHGGKPVGKPLEAKIKPEAVPAALREWAARDLDGGAGTAVPLTVPKAESKQLAGRAREFLRLGNWTEAAALLEAALLLDPESTDLRADAITAIQWYTDQNWHYPDHDVERLRRAMRAHRRGLEHLESLVNLGGDLTKYRSSYGISLVRAFLRYYNRRLDAHEKSKPECRALIVETQRVQRETLLRIIPTVAKQGKGAEQTLLEAAVAFLSPREKYELLEAIIVQLRHLPKATDRTVLYCMMGDKTLYPQSGPEFEKFLDRLAANPDTQIRAAGETLRKQLAADLARPPRSNGPPPLDPNAPRLVTFRPVTLAAPDTTEVALETQLTALVAAGPRTDVIAATSGLYVMKEKGKPRRVWSPAGVADRGAFSLCYDGRYAWAWTAQRFGRNPLVFAIDPESEKVWAVNGTHGLPERAASEGWDPRAQLLARAVALGPGRVCVAGSLGGRAWVGIATLDPKDGPRVKVIHEAKELVQKGTPRPAIDPKLAFDPTFMLAVRGRSKSGATEEVRVVLGRSSVGNAALTARPLLIDPDRATVELSPIPVTPSQLQNGGGWSMAVADGALYLRESRTVNGTRVTTNARMTFPAGVREQLDLDLPRGGTRFFFNDGRLFVTIDHVWGEQKERGGTVTYTRRTEWWQYDPGTGQLLQLSADAPRVQFLAVSAQYGFVTVGGDAHGVKSTLHTVTVEERTR